MKEYVEGRKPQAKLSVKKFLKAIEDSWGIKRTIADRLGCTWQSVNNWCHKPEIRDAYEAECERIGDVAESRIITCIKDGENDAVATKNARWHLVQKCQDRGYQDNKTITHEGGVNPVKVCNIDLDSMPIELKLQIMEYMEKTEKDELKAEEDG